MALRPRFMMILALLAATLSVNGCATPQQPPVAQPAPADPYEEALSAYWQGHMAASRAIVAMRALAEAGDPRAEYWLGLEYLSGGILPRDDEQGISWIRRAAEHDNPHAQVKLAYMYHYGQNGLAKDEDESDKWLQRAHALGETASSPSMYNPENDVQY